MNTKKLTEAAMLSALFVGSSIMAIYTGVGYTLYLDMIVPLFICIIYMRVDLKYTILASITSLLIVILGVGDIASGIWMSQGIIMGLICGYFINKKGTLYDNFFYSAILGCFVMVLIDVYFSKLTGYSFMKEFDSYRAMFPMNEEAMQIAFYIFVAAIPISTMLIAYMGALFIGNKLSILNENSKEKFMIIYNFRRLGNYICCSKSTFFIGVIYILLIEILKSFNFVVDFVYLRTVVMSIRIIVIYFILKDSLSFVMKGLSLIMNSKGLVQLIYFMILYLLLIDFKSMFIILVFLSIVLNSMLNLRNKQINILEKVLVKR